MTDLVQLKLTSGEWLIGEVQGTLEKRDTLKLKEPLLIQIVPQSAQQYGLALVPFNPTDPKGVAEIFISHIVARPEAISKDLHDAYMRQASDIEIVTELDAGIAGITLDKKA